MSACSKCGGPVGQKNTSGACHRCFQSVSECVVAGCTGRVASYSASGLCASHRRQPNLLALQQAVGGRRARELILAEAA